MPKVSIIVPVYKAEQYLHRCIDSILSQSFTDWECILVDDGSPDRSGAICDEYAHKDARIRVIHKDKLPIGEGLGENAIDTSVKILLCLIYRHYYTYFWHIILKVQLITDLYIHCAFALR